jgi:hypothetical protein
MGARAPRETAQRAEPTGRRQRATTVSDPGGWRDVGVADRRAKPATSRNVFHDAGPERGRESEWKSLPDPWTPGVRGIVR